MNAVNHKITILHREPAFVIIDKPPGLLAVPGRGPEKQDCVVNRAKKLIPEMISQPAVHRLDMATSGLMVLAVDKDNHAALSRQFEQRQVRKKYVALLDGLVKGESGRIELRFRLDPDNRPYQIYDPIDGKLGITDWNKLNVEDNRTRIKFTPITGRTHQLRLHAAHEMGLNTPIIGDNLYGNGKESDRMLLHACKLVFHHPISGKVVEFESMVPF